MRCKCDAVVGCVSSGLIRLLTQIGPRSVSATERDRKALPGARAQRAREAAETLTRLEERAGPVGPAGAEMRDVRYPCSGA